MKIKVLIFLIGFVLGAGSIWLFLLSDQRGNDQYFTEQNDSYLSGDVPVRNEGMQNRIVIPDQEYGGMVAIQFVSFNRSGWLVIHELLPDGSLGNALGAQRFDVGEYSGGVSLLRVTESGSTYSAVLYTDNGDKRFDLGLDLPELDESNNLIKTEFSII